MLICCCFRVLSRILTFFPLLYISNSQALQLLPGWDGWVVSTAPFSHHPCSQLFVTPHQVETLPQIVTQVSSPPWERGWDGKNKVVRKHWGNASLMPAKGAMKTPVRLCLLVITPCSEIPALNHLLLLELREGLVSSPACADLSQINREHTEMLWSWKRTLSSLSKWFYRVFPLPPPSFKSKWNFSNEVLSWVYWSLKNGITDGISLTQLSSRVH